MAAVIGYSQRKINIIYKVGNILFYQLCQKTRVFNLRFISQDMSDLFGCDLPSEDGAGFSWRDGPLLKALKQGNWILLDEMNLASQAVLEGY